MPAGIVPRRAGTAIRVRGIDEPNENENTWDNAESDNRKGKTCTKPIQRSCTHIKLCTNTQQAILSKAKGICCRCSSCCKAVASQANH